MSVYVVGVAGGSASGKTSMINDLLARFGNEEIALLCQDNYYFERERQKRDHNGEINFDLPTAIDQAAFKKDLEKLISGESVEKEEYTFNNPQAEADLIVIEPATILIVEGLFVFHFAEIAELLDLKVYIEARDEVKLQRRIRRDSAERGYPESDVRYRWENHVKPSYHSYLRPYRDECDLVITNNSSYDKGLEVLIHHLQAKIS